MECSKLPNNILTRGVFPPSISLVKINPSQADEAVAKLLESPDFVASSLLGVSYHISLAGRLAFFCIASCQTIYMVNLSHRKSSFQKGGLFASLLSGSCESQNSSKADTTDQHIMPIALVSFQVARTAIQLHEATRLRVNLLDISSFCNGEDTATNSPAQIVRQLLDTNADSWKIARLWFGNEKFVDVDVPMQAWLAAWRVLFHFQK